MPVNRELWRRWFGQQDGPEGWHCPTCAGGYVRVVKGTFYSDEAADSRWAHKQEWFDADHVKLRFSALLSCSNDKCKEVVVLSGVGRNEQEMDEDGRDWSWQEVFKPLFVHPPARFIPLHKSLPNDVSEQLSSSFALLWSSPSAAANHVRIAVENMLDVLRVPRAKRIKGVRMAPITLHQRIELFRTREAFLADSLLAIKWIGNAGSHIGELTQDDVFDAYDILDRVLDDLFVKNRSTTAKLVREINQRKGPRTK